MVAKRKLEYVENYPNEHHVILCKYGEDVYVDETTIQSSYLDENGRIENVVYISGNCSGHKDNSLILTQTNIVELRDICNILIEKESKRIGN